MLQRQGHKPAKNETDADLIVLNCCSVRQAAMHRVYDKVNKYSKIKKVILAGCVLEKDKKVLKEKVAEIWHPDKYFECSSLINPPQPSLRGGSSPPLGGAGGDFSKIAYVPIMTGCNNFCSYCAVPYTRGREKSRKESDIISEVKSLIKKGSKEIMLLGQNVNSYSSSPQTRPELSSALRGLRKGNSELKITTPNPSLFKEGRKTENVNFALLLKTINGLPSKFKLSFMTSHPKDMSDKLIKTMAQCEKLVKELHLPIQSGDDTILRKMNRKYTTKHYLSLLKKIRKAIPGIKISTDIIVGFPGETKKQFENTVKLCKQANFSGAFVAKYSPRPGTAASKMKDDVPQEEKKRRWRILDTLINKFPH